VAIIQIFNKGGISMALSQSTIQGITAAFAQPNGAISIESIAADFHGNETTTLGFAANMAALADAGVGLIAKANPLTAAAAFGLGAAANLEKASNQLGSPSGVTASTALEAASNLAGFAGSIALGAAGLAAAGAAAPALAAIGVAAMSAALVGTLTAKAMDPNISIDQEISKIQQGISDMANAFGNAFSHAADAFSQGMQNFASGNWFNDMMDAMGPNIIKGALGLGDFLNGIGQSISDFFTGAQKSPYRGDPLTLDLNGDGLNTEPLSTPPLFFDINATGIKQSVGWIAPTDGLLVMDRNGNGMIDSGAELFGNATPAYGTTANTADGFAALAQEDTNHDGVVNAQDANFASLRVWQDLNQDGISQSNELTTLDQQGIVSFNVGSTQNSQILANGNQIANLGTFTRTDGSTGSDGTPTGMGDINLAVDTFHSTFTDTIPLTAQAQALPDMQGSGMVRSLREAASLQTAAGQVLAAKLTQFANATTRTEQMALLDDLITAWGNTSGYADMRTRAQQHGYAFNTVHITATEEKQLSILEQFNGRSYYAMPWDNVNFAPSTLTGIQVYGRYITVGFSWVGGPEQLLNQAYADLKESVYEALLPQTRLKPYLDQINLTLKDDGSIGLDFTAVEAAFTQQISLDPVKGIGDLLDFNNYNSTVLQDSTWQSEGSTLLHDSLGSVSYNPAVQQVLADAGIIYAADGTAGNDILIADGLGDVIRGFYGNDVLISGKGADVLIGGLGNDTYKYQRGDGADILVDNSSGKYEGFNSLQLAAGIIATDIQVAYDSTTQTVLLDFGNGDNIRIGTPDNLAVQIIQFDDGSTLMTDALLKQVGLVQNGTAGADTLQGSDSLDYGDVLNGGVGNDTLNGGAGNDTYVYNLGDGADKIIDSGFPVYQWWAGKTQYSNINVLKFGAGIDATMVRSSFDSATQTAVLTLPDGGRIDIGTLNDLSIQTLQFADGSTLAIDTLFAQQMLEQTGTADADVLTGSDSTVFGDHLLGLGGDDALNGGAGNDVLEGGIGNDVLNGGTGSDTYVYNQGDGADTIIDSSNRQYSWQAGDQNTLSFGTGITADMLTPRFDSASQTVTLDFGNGDSIQVGTLNNFSIQSLQFADGSTQTLDQLLQQRGLSINGTTGADVLTGSDSNYTDYLTGGAGNDVLNGGTGNDTYVFNLGDGADMIVDHAGEHNVLALGTGITTDSILPRLDGVTGEVRLDFGGGDSISVGKYDAGQSALSLFIEQINFADGTTADLNQILAQKGFLVEGGSIDDTLHGAISNQNRMFGFDGNDTLLGGQRDDTLDGGAGDDTLLGDYGNDVLTGGLGNDVMSGGAGNDVYVYNLGDGADTVNDSIDLGQINTVRLGAGADIQSIEYQGGTSGDVLLNFADGGSLRIAGVVANNVVTTSSIQRFELADGTVLSAQQLLSQFTIQVNGMDNYGYGPNTGDLLNGTNLDDYISGYAGDDTLLGGSGNDVLDGGTGNDVLSGNDGLDTLYGGDGDDTLYGGTGNDVLAGGTGNDVLQGGAGNDTYVFKPGDGEDRITDSDGTDILHFGQGIAQSDLTFSKSGVNLRIALPGGSDSVVLDNWFTGTNTVNTLQFDDGSTLDLGTIAQSVVDQPVVGTAGDDTLVGSIYNDVLQGGPGNDTLVGGTGDDVYRFDQGDGVDKIYELSAVAGVRGNDTIEFGAGITPEMLTLSMQVISLDGGATWPNQTMFPDPNADLMEGDQQRQVLNIQVGTLGDAIQVMSGKGAIENFRFADGSVYTWQEMFHNQGGGIVSDSNDGVWTNPYGTWDGTQWIPQVVVPDRVLDGTGLAATFDGGIGNDMMLGGLQDDTYLFNLGDGKDVIADFGGQDEIVFGAGITAQDLVWHYDPTAATPFVLNVGSNGDSIAIVNGERGAIENFRFDDGSVLSFADLVSNQGGLSLQPTSNIGTYIDGWSSQGVIYGTNGDDYINDGGAASFIVGGAGNDSIDLYNASNVLLFQQGDGQDTVNVGAYAPTSTLLFGPDVDPASLKLELFQSQNSWDGSISQDMRISYGSLGDSVTVHGAVPAQYAAFMAMVAVVGDGGYGGGYGGEIATLQPRIRLQFADGTVWSYDDLLAHAENMIVADPYSPVLLGTAGSDTYVIGDQAADYTLIDTVATGSSNTVDLGWNYSSGVSIDPLVDRVILADTPFSATASATETAPFTLSRVGGSLSVQFDNGVTLNIDGFNPDDPLGSSAIREFKFADGTALGIEQVLAAGIDTLGTDAADVISGTAINDHIDGLSGDDIITGGKGNDVLRGGSGNDTYIFNLGDGADVIEDSAFNPGQQQFVLDNNVLRLGAGIDSAAVAVKLNESDGHVYLDMGNGDSVRIGDPRDLAIQTIQFDDGTVWDGWAIVNQMTVGTVANSNAGQTADIAYSATLANGNALPGWLTINSATGTFTGTPGNSEVGSLAVTVTATGMDGSTANTTFNLDVLSTAPIASSDMVAVTEGTGVTTIAKAGLMANDITPVAGSVLTITGYDSATAQGNAVSMDAAGDLMLDIGNRYQSLGAGQTATDSFSYTVTDTAGLTSTAMVDVTIVGENDAPVVQSDTSALSEDGFVTATGNVLTNDSDVDAGTTLQVAAPGTYAGQYGTLVLDANGSYIYTLDNVSSSVQSLAQGVTVNDVFSYAASDGITSTPSILTVAIAGSNDAPVVQADTAALSEDGVVTVTGNVLLNDSDVDTGATLQVAVPGTYAGSYGTLVLNADGSYVYTLNNGGAAVQSLAQDKTVNDVFSYATSDGIISTSSSLTLTITGKNDAPILATAIADQMAVAGSFFSYQVPAGTFTDVDASDNLSYSATRSDGQPLPSWLTFDAGTRTLNGTPPDFGYDTDIMIVATDLSGASTSDVFRLGVREAYPIFGTDGNDTLVGSIASERIVGNGGDDVIRGLSGNDKLDGGAGNDILEGGVGDDSYYVDSVGDVVVENANEGTDTVVPSISYTLGTNVENLMLGGTAAINGTGNNGDNVMFGNSAANILTGGAGNDTLNGGAGADTLIGGTGNDIYFVDSTGDVVTENANEGTDLVQSYITYTLGANVENLTLIGTAAIRGTGNNSDNVITGNSAANILTGGAGNDILQGGGGNDSLIGTSGNNLLASGTGADTLTGSSGNELYIGGTGNDAINTGTGYDIVAFNRGDGVDTVTFSAGQDNTLSLGGGIRNTDLAFRKSSNDLILDTGNSESIVLQGWYASTSNKSVLNLQMIEEASMDFAPGGGNLLTDNKVERFDFAGLVNTFDQARAVNPNLTSWALSNALLSFYLGGSDTEACGGDLAYQYGKAGSLSNVGLTAAQTMLGNAQFGQINQAINQVGLSEGMKLSA
jgi:VCBS repeat-containing protein